MIILSVTLFHEKVATEKIWGLPSVFPDCYRIIVGNVEKSRQRRSHYFVVLTYLSYAPRVTVAAALLFGFLEHSL